MQAPSSAAAEDGEVERLVAELEPLRITDRHSGSTRRVDGRHAVSRWPTW